MLDIGSRFGNNPLERKEWMRVIARGALRDFWERYPEAEQPLRTWFAEAETANWVSPSDVKAMYRSASILRDSRIVFNISGNKFRLIVRVNYPFRVVYIRFVGTHVQYDRINAETI